MSHRHRSGTFTGAAGDTVFWQSWHPAEPRGVVVLAHGLHEHSGRYAHVAERLVGAGFALHALDHRGHGRSGGTEGNIGPMACVRTDLHHLREMAGEADPGLPVVVLGHSMGGLVALDYVLDRGGDGLAGLVVSGPALDTSAASGVQRVAAPLLARFLPNLGVLTLGAENVSRDPEVVRAYEEDPLVRTGPVRARTGAEMLGAVQRVEPRLGELSLPLLVLQGSEDRLVPVDAARLVHDRAGSADRTIHLYDGLFHEVLNEPEREQVLDDLVGWLEAHA